MNNSAVVGGGETAAYSQADAQCAYPIDRTWQLVKLTAFDVLVSDVGLIIDVANSIDRDHIGMLEPRNCFGFAPQPITRMRIGKRSGDKLDRDQAIERSIARQMHCRHTARTEGTNQLEPVEVPVRNHAMVFTWHNALRFFKYESDDIPNI